MVRGVVTPFERSLEIVGVGFGAKKQGTDLILTVGFANPVKITPPQIAEIEIPNPLTIVIKSPDKQVVGQLAAEIRGVRPPDAYKGKGIRYKGEVVHLKAGKAFVGAE
jgi:large subunit ribosomal protein L6